MGLVVTGNEAPCPVLPGRKGPQRMEGDPGSRIATEAARLALQERQQGVKEEGPGSSDEGISAWEGEAGGSFWDLDSPKDPAEASATARQTAPASRCTSNAVLTRLGLLRCKRHQRNASVSGQAGPGRGATAQAAGAAC
jgi:hypothetical protein